MKRSKKAISRGKIIKALDGWAREMVFERDDSMCVRCNKKSVQWAHVYSRRDLRIRWEADNALSLCGGCHMFWWHKNTVDAGLWFANNFPERYRRLQQMKTTPAPKIRELKERAEALGLI
jgi:hypothetical protein